MAKKIRNTAAIDMTTSSFGGSVEMPSNQPTATDLYLAEQAAISVPTPTNGIEVTSVTTGPTTYTTNGLISLRGTLSETQRKILTVLYRGALENAMTAEEIHSLDTSVSVAQIKHHLYKDERLARLGLVVSARISGERTLGYRLTGMGLGLVRAR